MHLCRRDQTRVQRVVKEEGFKFKPYKDHLGNWTFGHGLTYITEDESLMLVKRRLRAIESALVNHKWYLELNRARQDVIVDMSYQMGINGMLGFKKMIAAIKEKDYEKAAIEMLDSRYAKQTPNRANRNANIMKTGGKNGDN